MDAPLQRAHELLLLLDWQGEVRLTEACCATAAALVLLPRAWNWDQNLESGVHSGSALCWLHNLVVRPLSVDRPLWHFSAVLSFLSCKMRMMVEPSS